MSSIFEEAMKGLPVAGPDMRDGEVVVDVIILSRVMGISGQSRLLIHRNRNQDYFTGRGMIDSAGDIFCVVDDDEDGDDNE